MGKLNLYRFRNKDLFQRRYSGTFIPDHPQHPQNQRNFSPDTQQVTINT